MLFVLVICSLCFIYLYGKKENSNVDINTDEKILQLNERINIKGQNKSTGEEVQIETFVEKVVLNSDSIAIFYQFEKSEDIVTSGIKDIEVVMKMEKHMICGMNVTIKQCLMMNKRKKQLHILCFLNP